MIFLNFDFFSDGILFGRTASSMANGKASISCQIGSAEIVHVYNNVIINPETEISKNQYGSDEKFVKSGHRTNKNSDHHASEDSVARGVQKFGQRRL